MASSTREAVFAVEGLLSARDAASLEAIWKGFQTYRASSTRRPAQPPTPAPPARSGRFFRRRPAKTESAVSAAPSAGVLRGGSPFRPNLAPRADAGRNFVRTGGRMGRGGESADDLRARNDYFRESYAVAGKSLVAGAEAMLAHRGLAKAAQRLHGHRIVEPQVVYANILLPGQELGLHTDVPEFRMTPGSNVPLWLRVVMRQSGKFERWRLRVATAVICVHECHGGDFAYYPAGPDGPAATIQPSANSAVVLEAESLFHGVDTVGGDDAASPPVRGGSVLRYRGDDTWDLVASDAEAEVPVASYASSEVRFSASWKAFCFESRSDRGSWRDHTDDLRVEDVLPVLLEDMGSRGVLTDGGSGLDDRELGLRLIDEYVHFPPVGEPPETEDL